MRHANQNEKRYNRRNGTTERATENCTRLHEIEMCRCNQSKSLKSCANTETQRSDQLKNQELPKAIEWIANLRDIQVNLLRQQVDHLPELVRKAVIENPQVCELLGYDPPNVVEDFYEDQPSSHLREEFDYSDIEEAAVIATQRNPENPGVQKRNILGVFKHLENFSSKV